MEETDECYYLGEYTARKGYSYSPTNGFIHNLKKHPKLRNTTQWRYKQEAIAHAGQTLRQALRAEWLQLATLVPIPPSKVRGHEEYDDRMVQVLRAVAKTSTLDIRELVLQRESTDADHNCDFRRTPYEIAENYYIDPIVLEPTPAVIGIFDDVLTKGSHFKAMQMVLGRRFPEVQIIGVFLARRVPQPDELSILDAFFDL